MKECNATARRTGQKCTRPAEPGRTKCRYHGGKSLSGSASGTFRTGKYSKDIPTRLLSTYQQALSDTELLTLREEIGLVDARLIDLLKRVDTGESGAIWQALVEAKSKLEAARATGDKKGQAEAFSELLSLIDRGASDYGAWAEVHRVLEQRRKLTESERKRLVDMQQMITAEKAMLLCSAIADVIRTHVSDRKQLAAISAGIGRLISGNAPDGTLAGDD